MLSTVVLSKLYAVCEGGNIAGKNSFPAMFRAVRAKEGRTNVRHIGTKLSLRTEKNMENKISPIDVVKLTRDKSFPSLELRASIGNRSALCPRLQGNLGNKICFLGNKINNDFYGSNNIFNKAWRNRL